MKNKFSSSIGQSLDGRSTPADRPVKIPEVSEPVEENQKATVPSLISGVSSAPPEIPKKHAGGRPTNKSKGITNRKQITITLTVEMHKEFLSRANAEGISLAKYVERALNEYKNNHG